MKKYNFFKMLLIIFLGFTTITMAKSAKELDYDANMAINKFIAQNSGGDAFLIFPDDMVEFVFGSTGMMGNFTMEGTKFDRITP